MILTIGQSNMYISGGYQNIVNESKVKKEEREKGRKGEGELD